ncbi:MAG: NUDIX domain-containing protein, partial [Candidatus Aenigmatarchaeota archaeon]
MEVVIGVKAVIVDDGKVLLMRRSDGYDYASGWWDIPGGRTSPGEEPLEGLKREVKEETGMELKDILRPLDARTVFNDGNTQIVRITFLCTADGDVNLSKEHTHFEWRDLKNLDAEFKDLHLKEVLYKLKEE